MGDEDGAANSGALGDGAALGDAFAGACEAAHCLVRRSISRRSICAPLMWLRMLLARLPLLTARMNPAQILEFGFVSSKTAAEPV